MKEFGVEPGAFEASEKSRIKDIADRAQLRSIENKRQNGWKLLPEDEAFLVKYEAEQKKGTGGQEAYFKDEEEWAIESTRRWIENKPKVEALAAEYRRAGEAARLYRLENRETADLWVKAEQMVVELGLNKTEESRAWRIAQGHSSIDKEYPPNEITEALSILEKAKKVD